MAAALNRALLESRDAARFVTAVCAVLDTSSGRLDYANCGHNPPLVLRAGGQTGELPAGGPALGLLPDVAFGAGRTELAPGDRLVLYTDGVVEVADGADAEFGLARLEAGIRAVPAGFPEQAIECVVDAARRFSRPRGFRRRLHARRPRPQPRGHAGTSRACATFLALRDLARAKGGARPGATGRRRACSTRRTSSTASSAGR